MPDPRYAQPTSGMRIRLVLYWAFVGIPLLWGVSETIANATKMFR